eukprot:6206164-Pleurochrysis_carterae.AAC.3
MFTASAKQVPQDLDYSQINKNPPPVMRNFKAEQLAAGPAAVEDREAGSWCALLGVRVREGLRKLLWGLNTSDSSVRAMGAWACAGGRGRARARASENAGVCACVSMREDAFVWTFVRVC